ncbi:GrpB family protein [Haloferax sp. YSMS24]|uniref:GrpB family protein n=1 Tax=Haloferax sp. YSMS24 TaxID=3388425 RepID=UPI00398D0592
MPDEPDDHHDATFGLARDTVELVPHDPAWEDAYDAEVERLQSELDTTGLGFEHVGSTAIPGIAAKPIVDMLLLVSDLEDTDELASELDAAGYEERPNDVPDRRFFARGPPSNRTHYLSVTERGSDCHREQVAFRDALRADPELAAEYDSLKHELADASPDDRTTYTDAKSSFVRSVLEDADERRSSVRQTRSGDTEDR